MTGEEGEAETVSGFGGSLLLFFPSQYRKFMSVVSITLFNYIAFLPNYIAIPSR